MKVLGVDESGRGCVVGSLFICGASIDDSQFEKLRQLGVKDSKLLTPSQRGKLAKILPEYVKYHLITISPQEIDAAVLSTTTNLNWLEADKTIEILKVLQPEAAIIDCPHPTPLKYSQYIISKLSSDIKIIAEHKADVNHLIVGAASILAKVYRDAEITRLKDEIGIDFGSGYPSDPKTKEFIKEHCLEYLDLVRQSWSTVRRILVKNPRS